MTDYDRRVIVAIDGSDEADFALKWFREHVYRQGDEVIIIYVPQGHGLLNASKWENTVYNLKRDEMLLSEEEEKRIRADLEAFADKLRHLGMEGRVRNIMANKPEEGIMRAYEEEEAELIVVGTRGKSTLRRTFLGSVSDYLVHHALCTVVVCKQPQKDK